VAPNSQEAYRGDTNGEDRTYGAPDDTPLLWVIREQLKLTGTKFGCGVGLCGACVVHIDGKRAFSCQTQVSNVAGKQVTTIEGSFAGFLASRAEGLACRTCAAVRLLSVRPDHERG
jgi:aerobic-type carbon monoxide dehydrogenase small subunit (CoxS/CutS family)